MPDTPLHPETPREIALAVVEDHTPTGEKDA